MRRSRPLRYLFEYYHVNQGKFNLRHMVPLSLGFSTSILTMAGVTVEGLEDVDFFYLFYFIGVFLCIVGGGGYL